MKKGNFAFIDSQNLYLGVKSQGWMLDFKRFRLYLRDKYDVVKAFACIGYVEGNQLLYKELQEAGFILIFKPTLEYRNSDGKLQRKGNVDAELVLHTMIEWNAYNQAVIVSGDGDFHCLIEHLIEQKKLCKVIVPNKKFSSLLRTFNPYIANINLWKDSLQKKG
ncbi:MAG: NYN domain-containing protein [Patescibacteria group bacterium]